MYRDEVRNAALELDAVYKVNERDKQIAKQDFRLKMHGIFLLFAIGFILLMSFSFGKAGSIIVLSGQRIKYLYAL